MGATDGWNIGSSRSAFPVAGSGVSGVESAFSGAGSAFC